MSQASYRLEAPRPRPPPLPIRTLNLQNPPKRSPSPGLARKRDSAQTLLYDLPSAISQSPTRAFGGMTSPTSPTGRRASRGGMRMTPPPVGSRAPTPSRPARSDLEEFAQYCRAWYVLHASHVCKIGNVNAFVVLLTGTTTRMIMPVV